MMKNRVKRKLKLFFNTNCDHSSMGAKQAEIQINRKSSRQQKKKKKFASYFFRCFITFFFLLMTLR